MELPPDRLRSSGCLVSVSAERIEGVELRDLNIGDVDIRKFQYPLNGSRGWNRLPRTGQSSLSTVSVSAERIEGVEPKTVNWWVTISSTFQYPLNGSRGWNQTGTARRV